MALDWVVVVPRKGIGIAEQLSDKAREEEKYKWERETKQSHFGCPK